MKTRSVLRLILGAAPALATPGVSAQAPAVVKAGD